MRNAHIRVTGKLFFFSLTPLATSFLFTGLPNTAELGTATLATLFLDSFDTAAFSVILRSTAQQGGSTIGTFPSPQGLSEIPLNFTPIETGHFVLEAISNLQPISLTEEPTAIFASSLPFTIQGPSSSITTESMESKFTTTVVETTSSPTTSDPTQSLISLALHKSNTPAIVGGAIGATVLIIICLVSLLIRTKHRRRRLGAARMLPNDMAISNAFILPFIGAGSDRKYILNGLERRERKQNPSSADNMVIEDGIPPVLTVPSAHTDIPLVPGDTWGGFEI
ncbi:hypothetical protein BDP27DRAFT_226791 [Rhodocollybia butyracea]|uniref:Uncharacterized protein n=1 Tax=Rhodocollybia butyracea TaxID=206335 RepID=A0A9P5UCM4_9AGAR|nr:hypothetical protein BDP27DRAFT_226791 [Rhodocollybia butyracea]